MSALTQPRNTRPWGTLPILSDLDVAQAGSTKIYQGGIVMVTAGLGSPASAALGGVVAGIAELNPQTGISDSTGVADGLTHIRVRQGVFRVNNSSSGDLITTAHRWRPCFVADDNTVALTNNNGTRPFAGIIVDVDSSGVWVFFSSQLSRSFAGGSDGDPATISAAGAVPLAARVAASVTGTTAYTLANGTYPGQTVKVSVVAGASTPAGTITPTTARGYTSVSGLGALGDYVEFVWTTTGWMVGANQGVTVS